ncbi:dihydrofolate reductase family protein [Amycolatopsis sp. SID8362]|uniref:dihydrofolate reductase family protein n=1 Tax=Amycolatopsis sp. SID8362 TaxID=2690346 RepID=UPI00136C6D1C|nr:dihydrofolate reductase family protein [Amycolatopsis sp. SID8362]NBH11343.1 deaminase [Amycolatopsis sp. SID8362]NED48035.1 deaminase [Amycolatopsis sp. SID8362]
MGTIVVFENTSLDGVTQDATGEEGISRVGDWRASLSPADRGAWDALILEDALAAQALLLGRRSYEFFAARYPSRTGALADQMNSLPKYVVSTTLDHAGAWNGSTVLTGDVLSEVSTLKEKVDGEIRVYASSRLVPALIDAGLVDELRLTIFPFVLGAGERLFDLISSSHSLRLVGARTVGASLAYLTYQCVPDTERPID